MTLLERIPARTEVPAEDGLYTVEESTYHADRGSLSCSGAKLLLPPSCPAKFRQRMDNPPEPKPHFDFGHVVHRLTLGAGSDYAVLEPAIHGLKKDGTVADNPAATTAWKAADSDARAAGKVPIHVDDFTKAKAMADAVRNHSEAGALFARGHAEKSMYWTEPQSGIRLRGRADWLTLVGDRLTCVDLKTSVTANPTELVRPFWKFGYHMQASWYRRLLIEIGLHHDPDFVFVTVEKEPPYLVTVVRYDSAAMAEGERLGRAAIDTYAECMRTGVWPSYVDQAVEIGLPPYAFDDEEIVIA